MSPYLNQNYQTKLTYRPTDVVISVPGKSGTTWTMNIVYQLRTHGNRNFDDIYSELTWIEVMDTPDSTEEDMIRKIDGMPTDPHPRGFKSHASPPTLPFREDVKYVVVARNPEEALVSLKTFLSKHSEEFLEYWGMTKDGFFFPDFTSYYEGFVKPSGFDTNLFRFVSNWWPLRNEPNVLMMHYSDMVKDHEGSVKKISDFLDYGPYTEEEWRAILQLTSFSWMKRHETKFEARTVWKIPVIVKGGMMRQGSFGLAREEGLGEDIAKEVKERGKEVLKDEVAYDWFYNGGEIK
mmetsp:Transcript_28310/g.56501  ORF Transcript_28310/g.56501 Transcript_28310/m.56501 type:complete len:293 (+) Transcript_28310:120-998(+)